MATTVNTDMTFYPATAQTAYFERVQDVIEVFNGASRGALVMRSEAIPGDFDKSAFFTVPAGMAHRDVNSDAAVAGIKLGSGENVTAKSPWKFGPYETTEEAYKRQGFSPEVFSSQIGVSMADQMLEYAIQASFGALDAATVGALAVTAPKANGRKTLTAGLRTMGDRSSRIALLGMSSATYWDYVDMAIDDKNFDEVGAVIYGGQPGTLGKPVLVSDAIADDVVYGLQPGAVQIVESQAPGVRDYDIDNQENLAKGYRGEGVFNLELMGYSYVETAGANPDIATLSAAASWTPTATSEKLRAGFRLALT